MLTVATFDGLDVLLLVGVFVLALVWWRSCERVADREDESDA